MAAPDLKMHLFT